MSLFAVFVIGIAVCVIFILIYLIINTPIFTVQEQQAVVIERLGKFSKVCGPGIHFMWPFVEKKRKFREGGVELDFVDQRERAVDLPKQMVITKDNVQLQVDSMAYYEITDPKKAVYGVDDVLVAVNQLIKTVLRNVIGDTTLQEMLSGREAINLRLRDQVENASGDWGITIRSVELQAVSPPESYTDAMRKVSEA
jgi:regulator of protease activity HflC (stomatin/prohibitin superfamily)